MTIEDINRAVNWTDTKGMVWPTGGGTPYKVNAGTKFGNTGTGQMAQADWNAINVEGHTQTPEEGKALTDYEINGYYYWVEGSYLVDETNTSSTSNEITSTEETVVFGSSESRYGYWLASRGVHADAYGGYAGFGPGHVGKCYAGSCDVMFNSYGNENCISFGLRPVVFLKSEIPN